jgi:xylulokinase
VATYLGFDIGTSAVKAVLVDDQQAVLAESNVPLSVSRPHPLWSEQDPEDWWSAVLTACDQVREQAPTAFRALRGVGLSGQMHGAVMLDGADRPLRPAILWNDGRAHREAKDLATSHPELSKRMGVLPMAGFTAPKLLWLARNQPEIFGAVAMVLLPKDYIRLKLSGERMTEMSDAAGTWWLDQENRSWSDEALAVTGLDRSRMPDLTEGSAPSAMLRSELAQQWGLDGPVVVAGGGGDAAAGAIGLGAVSDGAAFLSLGTSCQLFVCTNAFRPAPETLIHAFCHALPDRWFQMGAMLNGASCLSWAAGLLGGAIEPLLQEAEARFVKPASSLFLPYLSGERTPHNDPYARGVFFGLSPESDRTELIQAVLEGVAFSFADAQACLAQAGTRLDTAAVIGGGARSRLWTKILSNVLDVPLIRYAGADHGAAFGAARLARLAAASEAPEIVCREPERLDETSPEPGLVEAYRPRIEAFRRLYGALRPEFARQGEDALAPARGGS